MALGFGLGILGNPQPSGLQHKVPASSFESRHALLNIEPWPSWISSFSSPSFLASAAAKSRPRALTKGATNKHMILHLSDTSYMPVLQRACFLSVAHTQYGRPHALQRWDQTDSEAELSRQQGFAFGLPSFNWVTANGLTHGFEGVAQMNVMQRHHVMLSWGHDVALFCMVVGARPRGHLSESESSERSTTRLTAFHFTLALVFSGFSASFLSSCAIPSNQG